MRLGVLTGLKVYMNASASETNSNILRHAYQRVQVLHRLCISKISTNDVSVVEVSRQSRNVLRRMLLSLQSTVSRFLNYLQSTVSCVCCQPYHSNEHPVPEKW